MKWNEWRRWVEFLSFHYYYYGFLGNRVKLCSVTETVKLHLGLFLTFYDPLRTWLKFWPMTHKPFFFFLKFVLHLSHSAGTLFIFSKHCSSFFTCIFALSLLLLPPPFILHVTNLIETSFRTEINFHQGCFCKINKTNAGCKDKTTDVMPWVQIIFFGEGKWSLPSEENNIFLI